MKNNILAAFFSSLSIFLDEFVLMLERIVQDEKEVLAGSEAEDDPDIDNHI